MTELELEIENLNNFICCMLLAKDYDQEELSQLFTRQFELYGIVRDSMVSLTGQSHPLIDQFDYLLFERRLQITLFLQGIQPLPRT